MNGEKKDLQKGIELRKSIGGLWFLYFLCCTLKTTSITSQSQSVSFVGPK